MKRKTRLTILWVAAAITIVVGLLMSPIEQPVYYHDFADDRTLFGIPNFMNVATSLAFLPVGIMGLYAIFNRSRRANRPVFIEEREKWPWVVVFAGITLTAFASIYYHLSPSHETLVWDRVSITLVATGILCAVLTERVSIRGGLRLMPPLALIGIATVFYWIWTEQREDVSGNLVPYALIQVMPFVIAPLAILMFSPRYNRTGDIFVAMALYVAAMIFEVADAGIYAIGGIISGHSLKHFTAAACIYWLFRMIDRRQALQSAQPVVHARRRRNTQKPLGENA